MRAKIQSSVADVSLAMPAMSLANSKNLQVVNEAFLLIGYYLKNGLDSIGNVLVHADNFEFLYKQVHPGQHPECLQFIAWSLYILSLRCFQPNQESAGKLALAQTVVQKLTQILSR